MILITPKKIIIIKTKIRCTKNKIIEDNINNENNNKKILKFIILTQKKFIHRYLFNY